MNTDSRTSSTDPRDLFISLNPLGLDEKDLRKDNTGFADERTHSDYLLFLAGYRESHPEPQHHAEPIAWMVGTAIWWHKDGAERDSEERTEPMVPLGPCDSPSEIARVTAQFKEWQASHHRNYCKAADERDELRGQLDQARRLLHIASIRLANWLEPDDDPRKQIIAFLEDTAEPTGTEEQPGFELIGPQLLEWNRSLVQPCILIGHEYGVATKAMKLARQALSGKSN
ncbi:hypothetical protein GEV41_10945 [Pseudomonas putida]|uniref:hypothetical protein n=1 Tax=Pseudomonas putida group TaxID=136845 RepID=UPI00156EE125|nr:MULTISPECIES: hypothetical protein [Pseudomonas putida group]MCE0992035.1 hypothetical protein [Pseudomonas alloputida]QKL06912.1 hypothetical protein GEV41_10945 [Pseudomonas putida]WNI10599.1 hypothetical protein RIF00_11730 [Pseudomonas putida]